MKANLKLIKKHRKFKDEFIKSIVKDFASGKFSVVQLEKLRNISTSSIYRWIWNR